MTSDAPVLSPGALIGSVPAGPIASDRRLWGFGGVHGGLVLAMMTAAMREHAGTSDLRYVTAQFHRPITSDFTITAAPVRAGRAVTTVEARATTDDGTHVTASGGFGSGGPASWPDIAPRMPAAPSPSECEVFTIPPEFVPIADRTEIRPVGAARPYAGCPEPELTAWIRLVEDDRAPDPYRFVFLTDALAPSYAAILTTLQLIPTVELSVSVSDALFHAASPWVLVRARTRVASASGWSTEDIDAWGPDGAHLGSARQVRLARPAQHR